MMIGAELAGEAVSRCMTRVGGGVPGEVSLRVGAAGIAPGGGVFRPVMVVHALHQHRGQHIAQRQPPTTPSHAITLPFSVDRSWGRRECPAIETIMDKVVANRQGATFFKNSADPTGDFS
jgi:hypothetical protein